MLSKEGTLKLSDFGCSSYFRAEPLHRQEGNLRYWPPEVRDMPASGYYPQGADTWVAGICGHEFVRGSTLSGALWQPHVAGNGEQHNARPGLC